LENYKLWSWQNGQRVGREKQKQNKHVGSVNVIVEKKL